VWHLHPQPRGLGPNRAPLASATVTSTKFIDGEPMKPATNRVGGLAVELERLADLLIQPSS